MSQAMANPFTGVGTAETNKKGNYLKDGLYVVKVAECIMKETFELGQAFIVEFEVLESSDPARAVGSTCSWFQKMKPTTLSLPAIKGFAYACLGVTRETPAEERGAIDGQLQEIMLAACVDGFPQARNAFKGTILKIEAVTKPTKSGGLYTHYNYSPGATKGV